jgi:hypothetical protein
MVKNRYMTQPDVTPKQFPTPTSVAKHVYRTEGLKGFYRGKWKQIIDGLDELTDCNIQVFYHRF